MACAVLEFAEYIGQGLAEWLDRPPSHVHEVDELWREALKGRGPLCSMARWLDGSTAVRSKKGDSRQFLTPEMATVTFSVCSQALELPGVLRVPVPHLLLARRGSGT